jgi:hypothetical protein
MSIPLFLAMTGEEIHENGVLPPKIAWMACHFSAGGARLTGIPQRLPTGSMLILDDRIPIRGHDATLVAAHLLEIIEQQHCSHVLLDFERPPSAEAMDIVKEIIRQLPCPVGVSPSHVQNLNCPIFVPPVPSHQTAEAYLSQWNGREIWLEAALDGSTATVTTDGCQFTYAPFPKPEEPSHHSEELHSHYHIVANKEQITFSFHRTPHDLTELLNNAEQSGVTLAVGLYQELGTIFP